MRILVVLLACLGIAGGAGYLDYRETKRLSDALAEAKETERRAAQRPPVGDRGEMREALAAWKRSLLTSFLGMDSISITDERVFDICLDHAHEASEFRYRRDGPAPNAIARYLDERRFVREVRACFFDTAEARFGARP